ncbi:MAG: HAD hydrolase family protein [Candidatus Bathyarchaeota archaeon]|nr:HAD hydrolase family protein [Candidatus Bathyarchaeota archaeon]MDH5732531.1 HAD hydrolase family protein [Candidatus Bathyarchaeota archaeon]
MNAAATQLEQRTLQAERTQKVFITDCEGPISKNDNAYELTEHFIPNGSALFALLSKYDDVQADIIEKLGYKAGDTLKLILPFLRAFGVTNEKMENFSTKNILLVPGAKDMLQFVRSIMPSFMVSTSYQQYMQALCNAVDFPLKNVYCTELNLDKYQISRKETEKLRCLKEEIVSMPMIKIPENALSINDFSERDRQTIQRLDEVFWKKISDMESSKMLREVNPVGGFEKAKAVQEIVTNVGVKSYDVMYVGDSITDIQSFQLVGDNKGLTVSFNGNSYAVREAEIAVLSDNAAVTSVLAEVFSHYGRKGVLELVREWSYSGLGQYCSPILQSQMSQLYPKTLPKIEIVTSANKKRLMKESTAFRKTIRGEAVGGLG